MNRNRPDLCKAVDKHQRYGQIGITCIKVTSSPNFILTSLPLSFCTHNNLMFSLYDVISSSIITRNGTDTCGKHVMCLKGIYNQLGDTITCRNNGY